VKGEEATEGPFHYNLAEFFTHYVRLNEHVHTVIVKNGEITLFPLKKDLAEKTKEIIKKTLFLVDNADKSLCLCYVTSLTI